MVQGHTLAPDERARLAEVLPESLHDSSFPEIEAAWHLEIEKRMAVYDRGEAQVYAADDIFAAARRPSK